MYDAPFYKGSGKLEGEVAIVTGGDSGIGRSVCVLFAREGADIAIVHLPHEQSDADVVKAAVEKEGRRAITIAGDVRDAAFCRAAADRTVSELGRLDVLVNNAAFQMHVSRFEDLTEAHFDLTVKTNLYGYFHMIKACLPHMGQGSAIINSGSVTGIMGNSTIVDYSMTKGGVHMLTRALSGLLAPRGIRVNAVAPGPVWTPLNPSDNPEQMKTFGGNTRMGRPAQPEECAPAYVFLASPQMSSFITGEILPVIGGIQTVEQEESAPREPRLHLHGVVNWRLTWVEMFAPRKLRTMSADKFWRLWRRQTGGSRFSMGGDLIFLMRAIVTWWNWPSPVALR